jgi:hypothetical protein
MRQLALAFLFCLSSSIVNAQPAVQLDKTVTCSTLKMVVEQLSGIYKEEPHWNGVGAYSKYIMFVNPNTQAWTLVEYSDNGMACIIGTGEKSTLLKFGAKT